MDNIIKQSINSRKEAFTNAYDIKDEKIINKIDDLFKRVEELGNECKDIMEFETKFASSPLNTEYTNLFTEIASSCSPIVYESESIPENSNTVADEFKDDLKFAAREATQPLRRAAHQEAYDKVRDIPVVNEALGIKQHIDFFGRFRKKD